MALSTVAVPAQTRRPPASIPTNVLVQIIRAEDERRWDNQLQSLLSDRDLRIRKRAALAAGRIGDERAIDPLVQLLRTDPNEDVRQMAAFAIGEIESPTGADALLEALGAVARPSGKPPESSSKVRARAVEALGKIAAALPDSDKDRRRIFGEAILKALQFEDARRSHLDRLTILLGLTAALRAKPDSAGPVIAKFVGYSDPRIVAAALNALTRLRLKDGNDQARELLLKSSDPIVRANAARVLGATEDKPAFDALLDRALHDSDLRVRVSAIRALGSLKDAQAAEPLLSRGILLSTALRLSEPSTAEKVSVSECDAFLAQYEACISNHVPAEARQQYKASLDQWRSAWKKLADNPQTKPTLGSACKQAAQQQLAALKHDCVITTGEVLEIATALGRLLPNSSNEKAIAWLRIMHESTKGEAVEIEIAFARIVPGIYQTGSDNSKTTWRQFARRAQGLAAIKDVIIGAADGSAGDNALKMAQTELADILRRPNTPTLALPDVLQAYSTYKMPDTDQIARKYLLANDVIVRGTGAEILGNLTPSKANTRALIDALPQALGDRDLNDAALAILDALAKQKNDEANAAIKTALDSSDHLIRRKAVALLKANGVGDFSDRIGTVKTRNTEADYRRAIARIGKRVAGTVETSKGSFVIEFLPEDAPLTVDNFIQLAKKGFFNGQTIPRVVPNFVIQAGDPRGDTNGGPGYQIRCEINELPYERGAVGMALSGKDTGGSQWFVTHSPQPHLDGGYTVFGQVIRGMEVVDNIARVDVIRRVTINER